MGDEPAAGVDLSASFGPDMFEGFNDVVVVIDHGGTILYANPFTAELTELTMDEILGSNIAEWVHPDDLEVAIDIIGMMITDGLVVPMTPALYRLRRQSGGWWPIEFMGTTLPDGGDGRGRVLVVGRYSGDRHLQDQIMELLTSGGSMATIVALLPEFGVWRHPQEHYAVFYEERGEPVAAGSELAIRLHEVDQGAGSPWARAAAGRRDLYLTTDQLPADLRALAHEHHLLGCVVVPVPDPLHEEPAILVAWVRESGPQAATHRFPLDMMRRTLTLVLHWRAQVVDLEQAARRDPLTGITNRTGFFELLRQPTGRGGDKPLTGVLYIDLDGFKGVNDQLGHRAGDSVLVEIARRLAGVVRGGDVVARLGGDEFAVLCPDLTTDDDLAGIAERIITVAAEPIQVGDDEVAVGASVGIAIAPTEAVEANPDVLVDLADDALYQAKAAGRGRWHVAGPTSP